MKNKLFIFMIALCFLACVDTSSPEAVDKMQIEEILEDIRNAFNQGDLDLIMSFYHSDFYHNGDDLVDEEIVWQLRLIDYTIMNFSDLEIEVENNFAHATFLLYLDDEMFNEPETFGDLSYYYFDGVKWQICGKDFPAN